MVGGGWCIEDPRLIVVEGMVDCYVPLHCHPDLEQQGIRALETHCSADVQCLLECGQTPHNV